MRFDGAFVRYLAVGVWNTAFGYGLYAALAYVWSGLRYGYVAASLVSNLIAITVAFVGYKLFVFRTKGEWLREWVRCVGVYSGSIGAGIVLLPVLVEALRRVLPEPGLAPYAGGALLTAATVVASFFGHRHFSFKRS